MKSICSILLISMSFFCLTAFAQTKMQYNCSTFDMMSKERIAGAVYFVEVDEDARTADISSRIISNPNTQPFARLVSWSNDTDKYSRHFSSGKFSFYRYDGFKSSIPSSAGLVFYNDNLRWSEVYLCQLTTATNR